MKSYSKLRVKEKILHHKQHLQCADKISEIISAQATSVCIRNIKQTIAHKTQGVDVHLYYSGNSPNDFYGFGNESYSTLTEVSKKITLLWKYKIEQLIEKTNAQLIHSHNEPDFLPMKLMKFNLGIPVIYDQHDFLSGKRILTQELETYEKYCNEENDGAIFITEKYRNLVSQKYSVNPLNIAFPNYGSKNLLVSENNMPGKLSEISGAIHLVYEGALDDQHPNITRYLVPHIKQLSDMGFYIDLFPSKNNDYMKYRSLKNVTVHKKLPPDLLIKKLAQYDFGLSIVNHNCDNMPDELRFGFWNKCFDYLLAGIPQITLDRFEIINDFIMENNFGFSVNKLSELKDHQKLSSKMQQQFINHILTKRENYFMENNVKQMHNFYKKVLMTYHQKKLNDLER